MKYTTNQIKARARALLADAPEGLRWSELASAILNEAPETPPNTISGSMVALFASATDITKIRRGLYVLVDPVDQEPEPADDEIQPVSVVTPAGRAVTLTEDLFYAPFAEWLKELDEVSNAAAIGGNALGGKWGTPDVIGVLKPKVADLVKFEPQIVSAEIKIDKHQPVIAFGQAVAYRLFSHKSYIVVPDTTSPENYDLLEALSILYGIGLVTFALDPAAPGFDLRVRAQVIQPDMFFVNQMARRLHEHSAETFEKLF
jgi:hypothetical protein